MTEHVPFEKTKSDILKTASRLFREKGWNKVNIEDIVKEVGVTRGAFYHYFKSREELIYAVTVHMLVDDNPFDMVVREKNMNALNKLRMALKLSLKHQLNGAVEGDMLEAMYEPLVFKCNVLYSINIIAPYIERLLIEGNEDGSISVQYPKHMSHVIVLIFNEWLNPAIFQMSNSEFSNRLLFLEQFGERLGMPVLDEELKEMLLQVYKHCRVK